MQFYVQTCTVMKNSIGQTTFFTKHALLFNKLLTSKDRPPRFKIPVSAIFFREFLSSKIRIQILKVAYPKDDLINEKCDVKSIVKQSL